MLSRPLGNSTAKETGEACVFYLLLSCFFVVMAFHMLELAGYEVFKYVKGMINGNS